MPNSKFQITDSRFDLRSAVFICGVILLFFCTCSAAQKIAVLAPEKTEEAQKIERSQKLIEKLESSLSERFKVLDRSLSETAFHSRSFENPFNLSLDEAKATGAAIGCDFFLLIKLDVLRRTSFERPEYYEAFAAVYAVSSRTGRLVFWKLQTFAGDKPREAEKALFDSIEDLAAEIAPRLKLKIKEELSEERAQPIEEVPAENSPAAKNFRPPLPFKRIKPEYTSAAYLYGVEATIDIAVDVSETGAIRRVEIVRWAGFGLDEAVTGAIRQMNWRPAERLGKTLPMRVLLRYNFKKLEKEE